MLDSVSHYQYYPFINMGHFALFDQVEESFKDSLVFYYKLEIENVAKQTAKNPYGVEIPFIWCSNNLMTSFITQVLLYEKMTNDLQFHSIMLQHRNWLFNRNP